MLPSVLAASLSHLACLHVVVCNICFCTVRRSLQRHLPLHVVDVKACLRDRGFAFAPEFGKEFAHAYIKHMGEDIAKRKKQQIAGAVEQYAMPQMGTSPWPTMLRVQWHSLVAQLAQHVGVDSEQLQVLIGMRSEDDVHEGKPQLHLQDTKLLIAGRQKGEQAPHFDRDDSADKLKQVYTVILYLTDGVDSTAFPQFPLEEFALPEFNADNEVQNAEAMRATVQRGHLDKDHYDRWTVRIGDMALFTQATMVSMWRLAWFMEGHSEDDAKTVLSLVPLLFVSYCASSAFWNQEQHSARTHGAVQCAHTVR